jgi:hypothetical protein
MLLTLLLGLPTFASDHREDFNQKISKGKGTSKNRKQLSDQFWPTQNNKIIHAIQYDLNEKGLSETFSIQSKEEWEQQQRENHTDLYHSFNAAISYLSGLLEQVEKDKDLLWTYKNATFREGNGDRISLEGICPLFIYDGTELKPIEIPNKCMYQIENIRIRLELLAILDILAYAKKTVFYKDTIDSYNQKNANALNFPLSALIEIRKNGLNNVLQCNGKDSLDDDHYLKIILQILEEIKSHCPTELHHNLIPFLPIYERRNSQTYIKSYRVNKHAFERLYSNQARSAKEVQETAHICFNSFGHYIQNAVEINDYLKAFIGNPFNIFCDILSGYSLLNKTIEKYNAFLNNRCFQLTQNRKIIFQGNPVHLDAHLKNVYQYIEYQIQKLNIPRAELAKLLKINKPLLQDVEPQESATAAIHVQGQNSTSSAAASATQRQGSSHKKHKRARRKAKKVQSNNVNAQTQPNENAQPQRIDSPEKHREEKQYEEKANKVVELTLSVPSSKQSVDSSAKQSEGSSDESTDQGSTNKSDHSDHQVSTNELSSDESTHEGSSDESNETKPLHVQDQHSVPSATPSQQQRGRETGTSHPKTSTHKQNNNKTQHHNPNHQTSNNTPNNTLNNGVSNNKPRYNPKNHNLKGEEQHHNSNDVIINHEKWNSYFRTTNKAPFRNLENMSIKQTAYAIELCETLLKYVFHPSQGMKRNELTRMFADLKFVVQPNRHGKGSLHHIFPAPDNPLFGQDKYFKGVKMNLHFPTGSQSFVYQYFTVLKKQLAGLFSLTKEYMEDNLPLLQKRLEYLNSLPASAANGKEKEKETETEREEEKEKEPEKKKPRSSPKKKNKTKKRNKK